MCLPVESTELKAQSSLHDICVSVRQPYFSHRCSPGTPDAPREVLHKLRTGDATPDPVSPTGRVLPHLSPTGSMSPTPFSPVNPPGLRRVSEQSESALAVVAGSAQFSSYSDGHCDFPGKTWTLRLGSCGG